MLQNVMMARLAFLRNGGFCIIFNQSTKILGLFKVQMLHFKKTKSSEENCIMVEMLNNRYNNINYIISTSFWKLATLTKMVV